MPLVMQLRSERQQEKLNVTFETIRNLTLNLKSKTLAFDLEFEKHIMLKYVKDYFQ